MYFDRNMKYSAIIILLTVTFIDKIIIYLSEKDSYTYTKVIKVHYRFLNTLIRTYLKVVTVTAMTVNKC